LQLISFLYPWLTPFLTRVPTYTAVAPLPPHRNLFDYDQVVNTQRDKIYNERRRALLASDLTPLMIEYAERTCDDILEANVDRTADPSEWRLDALASKMVQYCPLLEGLTGQELAQACGGNFEGLRVYLRQLAVAAYEKKKEAVDGIEGGLMQEAQKFFVLTQTDNLWKEHLQVGEGQWVGRGEGGREGGGKGGRLQITRGERLISSLGMEGRAKMWSW
jgi:preprotein translocase subunit SecA